MKARNILIAVAGTLTLAATTEHQSAPIGFREFHLGMTLPEFLAVPPLKENTDLVCTNTLPGDWDIITPEEIKAGVIGCFYSHQFAPHLRDPSSRHLWEKEVPLSPTVDALVRFNFYGGKLYQAKIVTSPSNLQQLEGALFEKWGRPDRTLVEKYPVESGFLNISLIEGFEKYWLKPGSLISIAFPDILKRMVAVTYLDTNVAKEIDLKTKALRAAAQPDKLKL